MYYLIPLAQSPCWAGSSMSPFHRGVTQRNIQRSQIENYPPLENSESYLGLLGGTRAPMVKLSILHPTPRMPNTYWASPEWQRHFCCQLFSKKNQNGDRTLYKVSTGSSFPWEQHWMKRRSLGWQLASGGHPNAPWVTKNLLASLCFSHSSLRALGKFLPPGRPGPYCKDRNNSSELCRQRQQHGPHCSVHAIWGGGGLAVHTGFLHGGLWGRKNTLCWYFSSALHYTNFQL